jgi:hypothetical protein
VVRISLIVFSKKTQVEFQFGAVLLCKPSPERVLKHLIPHAAF